MVRAIAVLVSLVGFTGCTHKPLMPRDYCIGIINDTDEMLTDTTVTWDGFSSIGGVMNVRTEKTDCGIRHPMPDTVAVEWKDQGGTMRRKQVDVSVQAKRPTWVTIYFHIRSDGSVYVRTEESFLEGVYEERK